jgi:general secretion pathway protein L
LGELVSQFIQVPEVVLLISASDVTLVRLAVPPLSSTRLQAALPSLIEDQVLGDTSDYIIAAGPEADGHRLVAVCDRVWLQSWVDTLRQLGARRVRVLPMSLCLPLIDGVVSAALIQQGDRYELALRLSTDEGLGLSIAVENDSELPGTVTQMLSQLVPAQMVSLSVPTAQQQQFMHWLEFRQSSNISLVDEQWAEWIAASHQVPVDLMSAIDDEQPSTIDWTGWRYPILMAMMFVLFNIVAVNADWLRLRHEGLQVRDDITEIFRRSFPNDQVILDPLAQMKQKIAISRQTSGQLSPSDYLVLSAALGEAWRESGHDVRSIAALEYRDGALSVKLKPDTKLSLEALQGPLVVRQLKMTPSPTDPQLFLVGRT